MGEQWQNSVQRLLLENSMAIPIRKSLNIYPTFTVECLTYRGSFFGVSEGEFTLIRSEESETRVMGVFRKGEQVMGIFTEGLSNEEKSTCRSIVENGAEKADSTLGSIANFLKE